MTAVTKLTHVFMQVKSFGPGLEPTGCIVNKPAEFTIDARGAGRGHLQIYAQVHFHSSPRCLIPHFTGTKIFLSIFCSRTQKASPSTSRSQIMVTAHISVSTYPPSPSNTLSSSPGERSMFPTVHSGWELTANKQTSASWLHFVLLFDKKFSLSVKVHDYILPVLDSKLSHLLDHRFHIGS